MCFWTTATRILGVIVQNRAYLHTSNTETIDRWKINPDANPIKSMGRFKNTNWSQITSTNIYCVMQSAIKDGKQMMENS